MNNYRRIARIVLSLSEWLEMKADRLFDRATEIEIKEQRNDLGKLSIGSLVFVDENGKYSGKPNSASMVFRGVKIGDGEIIDNGVATGKWIKI